MTKKKIEKTPMSKKEIAMIKKAKAGDERAFTWLFNKYKHFVDSVLYSYVKDKDEARDMTNIVFLKVHDKLSKFSVYDSFGGWLRVLTNRVAIDYLRIKGNKRFTFVDDEDEISESSPDEYTEDDAVSHMMVERVFEILDRYRPYVREIFELHYMHNMPVEMVASKLRMPVGTVKSILSRVRNKLKTQLNN